VKTLLCLVATVALIWGIIWIFNHLPDPWLFVLLLFIAVAIVMSIWR